MPQMSPLNWLPFFITLPLLMLMIMTLLFSTHPIKIQTYSLSTHNPPFLWKW